MPHFKTWGFVGQHTLERCEDPAAGSPTTATPAAVALACPSCGFSGSNLALPDALEGLVRCTCGHVFEAGARAEGGLMARSRSSERARRDGRPPAPRPEPPAPKTPILTRAETAECTCPDACERDHERD